MKVNDLYNLSIGLGDLAEKELNISTSLKLERNQKKVSEELVSTDKVRQKIIEKYKDENAKVKNGVMIKEEHRETYQKEVDELLGQDVDSDLKLEKIKIEDLGNITIKPRTLTLIESMLKENAE